MDTNVTSIASGAVCCVTKFLARTIRLNERVGLRWSSADAPQLYQVTDTLAVIQKLWLALWPCVPGEVILLHPITTIKERSRRIQGEGGAASLSSAGDLLSRVHVKGAAVTYNKSNRAKRDRKSVV